MDDLDRLYNRLVSNIQESFPHLADRAFQLGDVAEHLVPYRLNRRELGFDSVRQYELALMRLASGERGYLRADATVHDAFRRALQSPEPDAALLRDHARASVALPDPSRHTASAPPSGTVSPSAAAAAGLAPEGAPTPVPSLSATGFIPSRSRPIAPPPSAPPPPPPAAPPPPPPPLVQQPVIPAALELQPLEIPPSYDLDTPQWADRLAPPPPPPTPAQPAPPQPAPPQPTPPQPAPGGAALEPRPGPTIIGGPCRYCGQPLPEGRAVTYCPHCGQNVTVRHCPACSTELDVGWQFCITCGRAMDDATGSATTR